MTQNFVHCLVQSHSSRFAHCLVSFYPFGRQVGKACLLLKKVTCTFNKTKKLNKQFCRNYLISWIWFIKSDVYVEEEKRKITLLYRILLAKWLTHRPHDQFHGFGSATEWNKKLAKMNSVCQTTLLFASINEDIIDFFF